MIIRAPHFVEEEFIKTFLQENMPWLKSKIFEQQQGKNAHFDFTHGSEVFFFGEKVKLDIQYGRKSKVLIKSVLNKKELDEDKPTYLSVILNERLVGKTDDKATLAKYVKKQLEAFFKIQAHHYIIDRVTELSTETSLIPNQIKIRQYKARWGSCNNRGDVSFNYLLAMTPRWVIDYVIIHELCHLQHLNHSKYFWLLVSKYCPNYSDAKQWLIEHQSGLVWRLAH